LKPALLLFGLLAAAPAGAQEIVTLPVRPGVTQSFFIANMGGRKVEAAALLFSGGGGSIRLRLENGKIAFAQGNFLPRSRREFIRNGILPVILDNASDHPEMADAFRQGPVHALDISAIATEVKRRYPGVPVFLVGTSRGTVSAAHVAKHLKGEVSGVVLTATLFYTGSGRRAQPALAGFDWSSVRVPLLFVHHEEDACGATPYREASRLLRQHPLVTVHGGKPPESPSCDPFSAHGFFGVEAQTVDAIAAWMLGKPYPLTVR
jgi:pimeloyl-ACP methyl ester carboxylesterase